MLFNICDSTLGIYLRNAAFFINRCNASACLIIDLQLCGKPLPFQIIVQVRNNCSFVNDDDSVGLKRARKDGMHEPGPRRLMDRNHAAHRIRIRMGTHNGRAREQ